MSFKSFLILWDLNLVICGRGRFVRGFFGGRLGGRVFRVVWGFFLVARGCLGFGVVVCVIVCDRVRGGV